MTLIAVIALDTCQTYQRRPVKIVTNPGCAKFGVFLFSPLSCPVCDGAVLPPVLSLSGPVGLFGPGLVLNSICETFGHLETWGMGR